MATFFDFTDLHSCSKNFQSSSGSSFTLFNVNIRSLRKHWDEFRLAVDCVLPIADAFVLTEINIHNDEVDRFSLPGFNRFFYTRDKKRGGGIAVFLKATAGYSEITTSFLSCESLALRVTTYVYDLYLLAFYRPPSESVPGFLSELRHCIQSLPGNATLCITGDINIDLSKPSKLLVCEYLTLLADYGVEPYILGATREEFLCGRFVSSSIDHINLRTSSSAIKSAIIKQKLSDHYFVACQIEFPKQVSTGKNTDIRRIEIVDNKTFDKYVSGYDWVTFQRHVNHSELYTSFVQLFRQFYNASKKVIFLKQRKSNIRWISTDILSAIKLKDVAWKRCRRSPHNQRLQHEFRIIRNKVTALIRSAKRIYFQKQFSESRNNSAKTWSLINELRGVSPGIQKKRIQDVFGHNSLITANLFNDFFAAFSGTLRKSTLSLSFSYANSASAFLPLMTADDLQSIIFSLKSSKSPGFDAVRLSDLRRNWNYVRDTLLLLLNTIIETGCIPDDLKIAVVTPILKGGCRSKVENYRPISILPCLAKILEKFIFITMSSFIDKHNLMSPNQYGFIAGRGTQPLLDALSDDINYGFEHNLCTCACFLDVSKAFDTVSHSILLKKLSAIGFRGPFLLLLESFLSDRSQMVSVNGVHSSKIFLKSGVPQGSILSPLLFNIYVNDMCTAVSDCILYQYADDTLLLTRHLSYPKSIEMLQRSSNQLMEWFNRNLLDINISKTKLVCFHNPLKVISLNVPFFLHTSECILCHCDQIPYSDTVKYLGILLDSDLSWNSHLTKICSQLRSVSCLLYHIKTFMPLGVRKHIAYSLAYSKLRYGITIFGQCSNLWQTKVNSILKGILRNVCYNLTSSNLNFFQMLLMPDFRSLFLETVVLNHNWNDEFKTHHPVSRQLRKVSRYLVPSCYTRYGKNIRSFYVPHIFNSLPPHFSDITSKKKLKKALRHVYWNEGDT